jgi:tRNA dimethylallyltransferase
MSRTDLEANVDRSMRKVLFLAGPTATGKTELALEIAARFDCEIISVDSAMVYRGMDIGTAKPDRETRNRIPHRLIDICDPSEPYSAGRFRTDALNEIEAILAAGKIPLLVGGTLLYFRALERGFAPLPPANAEIRNRLNRDAERIGWPAMHARLAVIDPPSASRIHPHDPQRIQRALEVCELIGRPMSDLLREGAPEPLPFEVIKLHVFPEDRKDLSRRIADRFGQMMARGLLEEVKALFDRGDLHHGLPSIRAVGYRQLWRYLEGHMNLNDAIGAAVYATCQLAKRQLTWLRADSTARRFTDPRQLRTNVLNYIATVASY